MHGQRSWGDGKDFVSKADEVANKLSENLGCNAVYVSLSNQSRLFSFGMTGAEVGYDESRFHESSDTVCGVTIAKNERQVLSDARVLDEFSTVPYVANGGIVGYLGQPIRDAEANAIGAICAISSDTRIWSEADKLSLQMSCMEVEFLLATELLEKEMTYLSRALSEYDDIVMTLTNNIKLMTSVHGENGELLFATNCLLDAVDAFSLEDSFKGQTKIDVLQGADRAEGDAEQESEGHVAGVTLHVAGKKDTTFWAGTVQNCPGSVSFVSWKLIPSNAG